MNLVDEIHFAVPFSKLVFGIYQYQSVLGGNLLSTCKQFAGIVFHDSIVFCRDDTLCDDFLLGDVQVVSLVCLGGRGNDGFRETLVLLHAFGQSYTTQLAAPVLILAPGRTGQDATDNHLHAESFTLQAYSHHRVGCGELPVRTDIGGLVQELGSNLVEHLTLKRNAFRQNDIKSGDSVGRHHDDYIVVNVIYIPYFTMINTFLSIKMEISFC